MSRIIFDTTKQHNLSGPFPLFLGGRGNSQYISIGTTNPIYLISGNTAYGSRDSRVVQAVVTGI